MPVFPTGEWGCSVILGNPMTPEERNLITGLFTRLKSADSPQKDQEAEQLIQQSTTAQPTAPYLLVQTVLVQEHALANAQTRIQQLEKQVAEASATASQQGQHPAGGVGGFLSGLFGGHSDTPASSQSANQAPQAGQQGTAIPLQRLPQAPAQQVYAPQPQQPPPMPYPSTTNMAPSAGGGFLKSALGTAAGVAGGALLFQGVENLLGHNAGPFGGGGFGGGGFGGGGFGGGFGGPEVIENREIVNNYIDERGDRDNGGSNSSFLGGTENVGFNPGAHEDNRYDTANTDANSNGGLYSTPPTDDATNSGDGGLYSTPPTDDNSNTDDGLYSTPPTDDADSGSMDNSYDSGSSDSSSSDDSSYV